MKYQWTIGIVIVLLLVGIALTFFFLTKKKTATGSAPAAPAVRTTSTGNSNNSTAVKPQPATVAPPTASSIYTDGSYVNGTSYFNNVGAEIGYVSNGNIYLFDNSLVGTVDADQYGMPYNAANESLYGVFNLS